MSAFNLPFVHDKLRDHVDGEFNFRESSSAFHIYASAQPNLYELKLIFSRKLPITSENVVWYINLRDETVLYVNGHPISQFAGSEPRHVGWPYMDVQRAEMELVHTIDKKGFVNVHRIEKTTDGEQLSAAYDTIEVRAVFTEEQAVAALAKKYGYDIRYLRYCVTDHDIPNDLEVDAFVRFVYLHLQRGDFVVFHCHAGKGRSATFVEMLKHLCNKEFGIPVCESANDLVSLAKVTRHALGRPSPKLERRIEFLEKFKQYVEKAYPEKLWSAWLEESLSILPLVVNRSRFATI